MTDAANICARLRCPLGGIRNIAADFIQGQQQHIDQLKAEIALAEARHVATFELLAMTLRCADLVKTEADAVEFTALLAKVLRPIVLTGR